MCGLAILSFSHSRRRNQRVASLAASRRPQVCGWHVYVLRSLDFGEVLDFGSGYFRDRQHVRFMSCKPENTYGWSITISIVG
jgi:hypothetical protein